jgi:hypothetical protein
MSAGMNLISSWPGLSRPSTSSLRKHWIEVVPGRIAGENHSDLPRARPMFDIVFTLDGITDVVKFLKVNQPLQAVSLSKAIDESRAMFEDPANEIVCHPDIKDAIWSIGQNMDVATCHAEILQDVDGRDKPGHDEIKCCHE